LINYIISTELIDEVNEREMKKKMIASVIKDVLVNSLMYYTVYKSYYCN